MLMAKAKICSCYRVHVEVPATHRYCLETEMYYWECVCNSTMAYTPDKARTLALIRGEIKPCQQAI